MKGTVPYTGKAGSLIFVSCDVTHRDTGRLAENTKNGWCMCAVCENLKGRLLITDSNNRFFGGEASLNGFLWFYKADVEKSSALKVN